MIDQLPSLDEAVVKKIKWTGDPLEYDKLLFEIGKSHSEFVVFNPWVDRGPLSYIYSIPETDQCIVWNFQGNWIAKKFNSDWTPSKGYKTIEVTAPQYLWLKNIDLPNAMSFEEDIYGNFTPDPWDSAYKHVWYIDPRVNPSADKIWTFSCQPIGVSIKGIKDMGYVMPKIKVEINKDIPDVDFNIDECYPPFWNMNMTNAWELDLGDDVEEKTWLVKFTTSYSKADKWNWCGSITPVFPELLDVIFISYNESNSEANWNRVLEKAPYAKKVENVKGIFNAHKAAAEIATTDMFYVIDGDAWLVDDWDFNFQPGLFDRNCVYIFKSKNPVNGLVYGYGGVKLFPRKSILSATKMHIDFSTSVSDKIKVIDRVSNETAFNTDEFATWRSAFRECVKLASKAILNQKEQETHNFLEAWMTQGSDKPFGDYSIVGARLGYEYGLANKDNPKELAKINNFTWLRKYFKATNG